MSYTSRSLAMIFSAAFGLFALAGFGVVTGLLPLLLMVAAALAAPAVVLRDSADVQPTSHEGPWQLADLRGAIPAHAVV